MSLRLPYLPVPLIGLAPPTLPPATQARLRPLVPVWIVDPITGRAHQFNQCVLDTGADDCVFPLDTARRLGLSILPTPGVSHRIRWRGTYWPINFADVLLRLDDAVQAFTWPARVSFTPAPLTHPILGQSACLQFFDATFRGADHQVVLDPNPTFPGAIS